MGLLATVLACLALTPGCGGPTEVQTAPRPASHFAIDFERSGGLKASVETLVVRPGLRAYATAPRGGHEATSHFRMDARTAEEVRRELARAHFSHLGGTPNSETCADCYVYSITYHGHTAHFLDSKVPNRIGEVIDKLEGEVIAHIYRHVGYRAS